MRRQQRKLIAISRLPQANPSKSVTTTSTMTFTANVYASKTAYAMCASDNFAGTLENRAIYFVSGPPGITQAVIRDATRQSCCESCAANPLCVGSALLSPSSGLCNLFIAPTPTCSVNQYALSAGYDAGSPGDTEFFVSNGNCGAYTMDLGYS